MPEKVEYNSRSRIARRCAYNPPSRKGHRDMFERNAETRLRTALIAGTAAGILFLGSPAGGKPTVTSFDAPGSTRTETVGINASGEVAGYFYDGTQSRGFLRETDGTFATFAPSGSIATYVMGINGDGTTTGFYLDAGEVSHGFVRTADGTIATFDAGGVATNTVGISGRAAIAGYYGDSSGQSHGFVRSAGGGITPFDVSEDGFWGTVPDALNAKGTI